MMKKSPLFLILLLLTCTFITAQDGAAISFETENIDYGEIAKNSDGSRVFTFTNTGGEPLIIQKVQSSCGCTIPKRPETPIEPGETGEIEVKYDTNREGPFRKTITVTSNAVNTPMIGLKIRGTVLPEN